MNALEFTPSRETPKPARDAVIAGDAIAPIRILLVEDNPLDGHLAALHLRRGLADEHRLHTVTSLEDAVEISEREPLDVVLLDLGLPDAYGLSGLERLRDLVPTLPIIVLTGTFEHHLAVEALRCGAQDYVPKQELSAEILARVIRFTMERQRHLRMERDRTAQLVAAKERAEQLAHELAQSRERLELALHATQLGMWEWDLAADETEFQGGTASMLGYSPAGGPALPRRWQDLVHQDDAAAVRQRIADFLLTPWRQYEDTFRMQTAGGSSRSIMARGRVVKSDCEGAPLQMVGTLLDVTDRLNSERQAAQSQKLEAIGQLASGIAHEINTPMQYLGDNVSFLQTTLPQLTNLAQALAELAEHDDLREIDSNRWDRLRKEIQAARLPAVLADAGDALADCHEGVDSVAQIVRAMKEFSHPGGEKKSPVDVNAAINTTLVVSRNQWKYVADLSLDLDPDLPLIPALPGELNQVLLNLVVNAADAIQESIGSAPDVKGQIAISSRRCNEFVEVRVSDSGCGIPLELQARVFEPFFTTKDVGKGTGQGLAIAHTVIVQKHGGSLAFESEVGRGTTLILRVPLAAPDSADDTDPLWNGP